MKIFADENMPLVEELFAQHGELLRGPGRGLAKKDLSGVDVLLVRSVTKVNAQLLDGTQVQFVGSATAGINHVDQDYLAKAGIRFAYAPGSNANSVAQYVTAAILKLALRDKFELAGKTVGIVGHGQVGSRVAVKCRALGMKTLINDPPLRDAGVELDFVELDDLLGVDILTVHVPLTFEGPFATANLIDRDWLSRIKKPGMLLLNSARGGVLDEGALWQVQAKGLVKQVVLDVFEDEKNPQRVADAALKQADITTPHIAGYSYDGKVAGTVMLYEALAEHFNWPTQANNMSILDTQPKDLPSPPARATYLEQLHFAVAHAYDIEKDHQNLQKALDYQGPDRGAYFDSLRKNYPLRREFRNYRVSLERGYSAEVVAVLRELGFSG